MKSEQNHKRAAYFLGLPYQDQLNVIWQRGILLEARRIPGFWLHLYAVDSFFVEIWVCQRRYDVTLVRLLDSINELEPYIDKISLDTLLPN
ncbi:hypothetical protein [Spirosoma sp. KNUC1025]|uniref:hypothetical protein n=1 Tax=Spirosoma sp. KNUC1025 TaxID=2894082 RepID=UPI003867195D|nr:hypothetical protein LN737_27135 [Spirosoma sp. KNUC1025]